jgi:hypothetical protein
MADWQITATTIYCDAVDDEVTIMVYGDWSVACTGYNRYYHPTRETARVMESKSRKLNRKVVCEGLDCHRVTDYTAKLRAEEPAGEAREA